MQVSTITSSTESQSQTDPIESCKVHANAGRNVLLPPTTEIDNSVKLSTRALWDKEFDSLSPSRIHMDSSNRGSCSGSEETVCPVPGNVLRLA